MSSEAVTAVTQRVSQPSILTLSRGQWAKQYAINALPCVLGEKRELDTFQKKGTI